MTTVRHVLTGGHQDWSAPMLMKRTLCSIALVGLFAFATGSTANATLTLVVQEGGGGPLVIEDGGSLDIDGIVNGIITADVSATDFTNAVTAFTFAGLSATSNSLTGVPGSGDTARLTQTGEFQNTSGASASISIVAFDTGYLFPFIPQTLGSSANTGYTNTTGGDASFQSYFDQSDMTDDTNAPMGTAGELLSFVVPVTGGLPVSDSQDATPTALVGATTPFAISSITSVTLDGAPAGAAAPSFQYGNSTTVIGVIPEPASVLSLAFGLPALGLVLRRRRRAA